MIVSLWSSYYLQVSQILVLWCWLHWCSSRYSCILFVLLQFKDWWVSRILHRGYSKHSIISSPSSTSLGIVPQRITSDTRVDELVHWCHGAPGFANLLHQAYEVYWWQIPGGLGKISQVYLEIRTVLRKGFGLCHMWATNNVSIFNRWMYSSTQKMSTTIAQWRWDCACSIRTYNRR